MVTSPPASSPVTVTDAAVRLRLDAVIDGVLEQRLQQQPGHQRLHRAAASMFQTTRSRSPSRSSSMRW